MSLLASTIVVALEKGVSGAKIYLVLSSKYSNRELSDAFLEILENRL